MFFNELDFKLGEIFNLLTLASEKVVHKIFHFTARMMCLVIKKSLKFKKVIKSCFLLIFFIFFIRAFHSCYSLK